LQYLLSFPFKLFPQIIRDSISLKTWLLFEDNVKTLLRLLISALIATSLAAYAQTSGTAGSTSSAGSVSRIAKAVHYHQGGTVKLVFHATELMANAGGEGKLEAKKANITIDAKFQGMEDASRPKAARPISVSWCSNIRTHT
jgi:hypothetical protein